MCVIAVLSYFPSRRIAELISMPPHLHEFRSWPPRPEITAPAIDNHTKQLLQMSVRAVQRTASSLWSCGL